MSHPRSRFGHRNVRRASPLVVASLALGTLVPACTLEPAELSSEDFGVDEVEQFVRFAGTATASSTESAQYPASAAVDGNTTTRWSSAFSDPQWIQVDLGSVKPVNRVVLSWEAAFSSRYEIRFSSDGNSFTTVHSNSAGDGGVDTISVSGNARYVRLQSLARGTPWGNSLFEFEVHGNAGDPSCSTGIAADGVCCAASCGACGGAGCGNRPGGSAACCAGPIRTSGVSCSGSTPPCVLDSSGGTGGGSGSGGSGSGGGSSSGGGSGTGGSTNAPRGPNLPTLENGRGAVVPWVEYEAEEMATNGSKLGPTRTFGEVAAEASGRQAVRLDQTGEYVQFRNAYAANSIVLRYSIPDGGANYWTTISVYVNGVFRTKLNLTSRYSWTYGTEYQFNSPDQNNPALGVPHHFFDEARALLGDVPVGATVMLRKDANDGASRYDVDLVDMEQVAGPLGQPAGFLSLTNDCGAVPNDGRDDASAIQYCMDRARGERRGVYIPQGVFHSFSRVISVAGVTVRGAGMWYSTVEGFNASFDCWADGCRYSDFRINGDTTQRIDSSPETAFRGNGQGGSVIERMWVEHVKVGMFSSPNSNDIIVRDSRFRSLFADGVNFWAGTSNSVCENNHMRGTGDDSFAAWSDARTSPGRPDTNVVFRRNYVQAPWKANCFALYGGNGVRIEDNVCADVVQYPGILLARQFDSHPFSGTTRVDRNTLIRAGGWTYNQEHGALKFHADAGPISGVRVTDLDVVSPTYFGVHVQGQNQVSDVVLSNVRVSSPGSGVFFLNWGARGSLTAQTLVATGSPRGVRDDTGGAFNLIRGSGNSGW